MLVKPEVKELLISCGMRHKAAALGTVSRWIKYELSRAGANISLYKAHVGTSVSEQGKRYRDICTRHTNKELKNEIVFKAFYSIDTII